METSKKLSLQRFLNNRNSLILISFLIALVIWLAISLNEAPEVERVVEHVKVTIDDSVPSQLGYEAFGADDLYIDITVKGKRYLVGDNVLTADDFTVTAITTHVDAPGSYTLQLKATSKDAGANYTIVSKSQDYTEVYFDTPKTTEITVEPNVLCESKELLYSEDYITDDPIVSISKISVRGPATEVDKIKHAVATVSTEGELKSTETLPATLTIVDNYGAELKYLTVTENYEEITVTIPVYKQIELPVSVSFSGSPVYYIDNPLSVVCTPSKIKVAADETKIDSLSTITLGTVDFSTLKPGLNTIELSADKIKDALPIDKDAKYAVYINTGNVVSKEFELSSDNITLRGLDPKTYNCKVETGIVKVTVVGPQSTINSLKASDITAAADLSDIKVETGKNIAPLSISIKSDNCWTYGKYTVSVIAVKK